MVPKEPVRKSARSAMKKAVKSSAKKAATKSATKSAGSAGDASKLIDGRIRELGDWRGKTLQNVRRIIRGAAPGIVEEWKWGVPVWSHDGIICTGETYKTAVKLTFAKGASLDDPSRLFNSSLEGNTRRAIDIRENETINEAALTDLVRAAVAQNLKR